MMRIQWVIDKFVRSLVYEPLFNTRFKSINQIISRVFTSLRASAACIVVAALPEIKEITVKHINYVRHICYIADKR
jgi:hypothetical protein